MIEIKECPFCHKPLKDGALRTIRDVILWGESSKKNSFFANNLNIPSGDIQVGENSFFKGSKARGVRCEHCKMIIIFEES